MARKTDVESKVALKPVATKSEMAGLGPRRRKELLRYLEQEARDAGRERQAQRMARGLAVAMGIHGNGVDLIWWIADSRCRTNLEAMSVWILEQLTDAEFQFEALHTPEIDLLAQRLNRRLVAQEASFAW